MLRVLLGANFLALAAALLLTAEPAQWLRRFIDLAAFVEPMLLIGLGLLSLARDWLWRLPLRAGQLAVLLLAGALAFALAASWRTLLPEEAGNPWRAALLAMVGTALLLLYFELRAQALDPAQARARLAALNARIRPHFLFNSLNAVLSLTRSRPEVAETALESLADLFRAAMHDPAERVSLHEEIELARQYLELEQLRLGQRLTVDWQVAADVDRDLRMPPLMLQPLLENAIGHGIEPAPTGGTVRIAISQDADALRITISNPVSGRAAHSEGKHMALANIRERLALYYDLEARLDIEQTPASYEVRMVLPWHKMKR